MYSNHQTITFELQVGIDSIFFMLTHFLCCERLVRARVHVWRRGDQTLWYFNPDTHRLTLITPTHFILRPSLVSKSGATEILSSNI